MQYTHSGGYLFTITTCITIQLHYMFLNTLFAVPPPFVADDPTFHTNI